jgi:hypothetical protein
MVVVAAMAVMLIGATALATEDAFADKKKRGGYEKSQAVAQLNYCGNGELPENVWCQNSASQTYGDGNEVETASGQGDDTDNERPNQKHQVKAYHLHLFF